MAAAAVGGAVAVVAPMPPPPPEEKEAPQPLMALVAPMLPQPTPPRPEEKEEDEQPPVAAGAAVAPPKPEVEQPPVAADAAVVARLPPQPPQPEAEEDEQPSKAADPVSEAVSCVAPIPPPPPPQAEEEEEEQPPEAADPVSEAISLVAPTPPPPPQQQQQQPDEEEQPAPAAALPQPLQSGLGLAPGPVEEGYKETPQDKNSLQVQGSADEGDKETPQDENPLQVQGSADEGDKETPQDENPLQVQGSADEGDKETPQDKSPLHVPGPADEGDRDASQDKNLLQGPGPADGGDKVTLQDEDSLDDSHDHRDRGIFLRDPYALFHYGYPGNNYDLIHGGGYHDDHMDDVDDVPSIYNARLFRKRCHRDNVDPCHGVRCRGDHRDHRDCVDTLHGDRRGEQGDHSDDDSGDHRDHRGCVDALHGCRRGEQGDHSDADSGDHRDHRGCVGALHGCRRGKQGDHRDYDHASHGGSYLDDHRDHREFPYFLNRGNHAFHHGGYPGFYHPDPLNYAIHYRDRCGCMKCRFGGRRIPRHYMNEYNPMDSLDDERVYARTPCCFRNLISAKNDYPVGASLLNPEKWTCFLNCILQCVVHTVPLVSKLLKDRHLGLCPSGSDEFCCYCSLRHHASEAIRLTGNVLYPKKFAKLLKLICQDFRWGGHQDAHELLRCLLDKLDEASVTPRLSSEEPSSIVKEVFGGQLKSQLHCPECNHCSDRLESFLDLSLEINQMDTLLDSLESFTKTEVVESFICDGCKSRVNMEKHLKVEQAPEVLVIQLKRFENLGSYTSKIQEMVKYQLELDLKPFMSSADTSPQTYDLYGVVEHLGNSSNGHYVCYIRSSETEWYLFNDDKVMKVSDDRVLDSKAYLLFYVKQGSSPWFSTLLAEKDILLSGYLQELAEKGLNEDGASIDSDKGSGSGGGSGSEQDSVEYFSGGLAARNEAGPSLVSLSQGNANGSMHIPDKNEASCSLDGGPSGETRKSTSPPRSRMENGNVRGLALLLENNENVDKEMSHSTHGSPSQVNGAGTQGGSSSQENEESCSLLQSSSHKHEEDCCPENLASHKDGEVMGGDDDCDSPAGEVRAHYGVETRARKRMRQQSTAGTTAKRKKDGGLKKSLRKKRSAGWAARGRSKKKRR